jgi:L-fuculose-phosphate aldolase
MTDKPLHPAEQLARAIKRVYQNDLTTASGGNLSIMDANGDIWITPSGTDKGTLTCDDMCRVASDGSVYGRHKPSMELPFHAQVYKKRPDLRAVLHAHPPTLVAFSAARLAPDTRITVSAYRTLGDIAAAPYAIPGSKALGESIAAEFEKGYGIVLMENHGVCVGAADMAEACMKLEMLEMLAQTEITARKLGDIIPLPDGFIPNACNDGGLEVPGGMTAMLERAYRKKLFAGTQGVCSVRQDGGLIINRSRSYELHARIYDAHPGVNSIWEACPPHAMAFAVTGALFDTRTIPESYIMLRDIKKAALSERDNIPELISSKSPVLICQNEMILTTGGSLFEAYDRLEVAEAAARSVILARDIGELIYISREEIGKIDAAFGLK